MKRVIGLVGATMLAALPLAAHAQAPPPGTYQRSCWDIRMQGSMLSAVCRTARGREQQTALNVARCIGDIGNNNGNLVCSGGQPVAVPPRPGYPPPSGYPAPGYGPPPPPRYGGEQAYWEHCEGLRHEEHELRERLAYTPYGEEHERLKYRLGQIHADSEQCPRR